MPLDEKLLNYCHDPEIKGAAKRIGGSGDNKLLNKAYSRGEAPYDAFERSLELIKDKVSAKKGGRLPKSRLSKRQKKEILKRQGLE
jgi:hypothetical protein